MLLRQPVVAELNAEPILAAVDGYRGTILDLDTGTRVVADDFAAARIALGKRLAKSGIGYGDRVIVAVGNGPLFPATLAAILARGASPLLLHAKTPAAELKRYAQRYAARLILSDGNRDEDYRAVEMEPYVIEASSWARLLAANLRPGAHANVGAGLVLPGVPLHPTSGTTGQPKVALRPAQAAVAEARHYINTTEICASDTLVVAAPQSHAYCYGMGTLVPLLSGASVVTMRTFQTALVQSALLDAHANVFPAVPAMLASLMFGTRADLLANVHTVFSAGAPLNEKTAEAFRRKFGIHVRPLYGTTETGGIAISAAGPAAAVGACVGPPMAGVDVEVRSMGDDFGSNLGMLYVRSSSMMVGYLDEQGLDQSMVVDGWFKTGDLATLDSQGRIHLQGRQSEVINVAGMKVIPSEVESVLMMLPGIAEAKVYAREHRSGSQAVQAALVAKEITEADVRAHCEKHLVYYKRPAYIAFLEALPRNAAGKIAKDQLP